MSSRTFWMMKRVAAATVAAGVYGLALGQSDGHADAGRKAESTSRPAVSQPAPKQERADDPIPKATTFAEKKARFAAEFRFLQQMSTP